MSFLYFLMFCSTSEVSQNLRDVKIIYDAKIGVGVE
jgi:hypothetical protein